MGSKKIFDDSDNDNDVLFFVDKKIVIRVLIQSGRVPRTSLS